jgi:hypothetical protein
LFDPKKPTQTERLCRWSRSSMRQNNDRTKEEHPIMMHS